MTEGQPDHTTDTGILLDTAARIVVYDRSQIAAALAATAASGRTVVLIGRLGGVMGEPWFRRLVADVAAFYPCARFVAVTDCDTAVGFALAALAEGAVVVRLQAPPPVLERVRDIAFRSGAMVDDREHSALDLLFHADPVAACRAWLALFPGP
ncbi:MAG: Fructose/tagatose bisphosphate aldolase [Rhodospirillaceae bacterium]|nr:MAG: Fructose/tagatose bisphosphate aldolase [Rhodospirillaceae bacterium]